jgi:hypothetical protein
MTSEKINDGEVTIQRVERWRYFERNHRNGKLSFRVDRGARVPLPNDPTTSEFRRAYNEALVDAIAAEDDTDDWSELRAMHKAQRRGTAKHGGQRQ